MTVLWSPVGDYVGLVVAETAQKQFRTLPAESSDVSDVRIAESEEDRLYFELF